MESLSKAVTKYDTKDITTTVPQIQDIKINSSSSLTTNHISPTRAASSVDSIKFHAAVSDNSPGTIIGQRIKKNNLCLKTTIHYSVKEQLTLQSEGLREDI